MHQINRYKSKNIIITQSVATDLSNLSRLKLADLMDTCAVLQVSERMRMDPDLRKLMVRLRRERG